MRVGACSRIRVTGNCFDIHFSSRVQCIKSGFLSSARISHGLQNFNFSLEKIALKSTYRRVTDDWLLQILVVCCVWKATYFLPFANLVCIFAMAFQYCKQRI